MKFEQIKELINEHVQLLPVGKSVSLVEAERRAGEFLNVVAKITDYRHSLGELKIKFTSVQTAVYAEQMSKGTAKTVTENKLTAEASKAYTEAREDLELVENDLTYLKTYQDIFNNAHIFYRGLARDNSYA